MAQTPFDIELDDITLAQARRGQLAACERIFRAFQQPAYSVAFRICQCRETAEEVTQEAFITAFRKMRQFRGDAPFWGWLRRVVVNHAISTIRRSRKANEVEFQDFLASSAGEQDRVGLAMDLESALAVLDVQDRAVVWLHDVEGYGHQEIADLFGKTESFSKTRLSRARARLRDLLEGPTTVAEPGCGQDGAALRRSGAGLTP
jgi:RNA polymerase sigma-70 factor (ECF subfamily)